MNSMDGKFRSSFFNRIPVLCSPELNRVAHISMPSASCVRQPLPRPSCCGSCSRYSLYVWISRSFLSGHFFFFRYLLLCHFLEWCRHKYLHLLLAKSLSMSSRFSSYWFLDPDSSPNFSYILNMFSQLQFVPPWRVLGRFNIKSKIKVFFPHVWIYNTFYSVALSKLIKLSPLVFHLQLFHLRKHKNHSESGHF